MPALKPAYTGFMKNIQARCILAMMHAWGEAIKILRQIEPTILPVRPT